MSMPAEVKAALANLTAERKPFLLMIRDAMRKHDVKKFTATCLVYSDWLEERGDKSAKRWRNLGSSTFRTLSTSLVAGQSPKGGNFHLPRGRKFSTGQLKSVMSFIVGLGRR